MESFCVFNCFKLFLVEMSGCHRNKHHGSKLDQEDELLSPVMLLPLCGLGVGAWDKVARLQVRPQGPAKKGLRWT